MRRLRAARFRLLGEVHDHPVQHRIRAALIEKLAAAGDRAEVFFEQFDLENAGALREAQQSGADADALARAGRLDEKNWKWPLHRPIVQAALAAGFPVRAANLSRADARGIVSSGALKGDAAEGLTRADWPPQRETALRKELVDSHCGALPEKLVPGMALAQRARDATMARVLASTPLPSILIAGNGHVRRDRGVPLYLPRLFALLSVGFLETRAGESNPLAYSGAANDPSFDLIWFTAPQPRPDPCEAPRKR